MSSWGVKRQFAYVSLFLGFVGILIALPAFLLFYNPPSCSDGKQNQGEFGVDCGGPCATLCPAKAAQPIVYWQQEFEVAPSVWSAVAYIENPNLDSGAYSVPYVFKLYDENNILVAERYGRTFIPPRRVFTVFEGGFLTGERKPVRTLFEFIGEITWRKDIPETPELRILNRMLTNENEAPRFQADLVNPNLESIQNIEVSVIVLDASGNAIGASRTTVDSISKDESKPLVFTWPKPFEAQVAEVKTVYRVLPSL